MSTEPPRQITLIDGVRHRLVRDGVDCDVYTVHVAVYTRCQVKYVTACLCCDRQSAVNTCKQRCFVLRRRRRWREINFTCLFIEIKGRRTARWWSPAGGRPVLRGGPPWSSAGWSLIGMLIWSACETEMSTTRWRVCWQITSHVINRWRRRCSGARRRGRVSCHFSHLKIEHLYVTCGAFWNVIPGASERSTRVLFLGRRLTVSATSVVVFLF